MEVLSPAGSPEAVIAAVCGGADAIYLGYGDFNARRNAKNFTRQELEESISYCHLRDCKVYLTLNTLVTDRELPAAVQLAGDAASLGVDAVLVQDLGLLRALRRQIPELSLHASTQMTLHSLDGVKQAADLGLTRVVLSRELSRDAIEEICAHSPIEIEVFVHGALCMCYSGQCFFSSVIGGRSGNRGLCAQPCRLPYGWNGKADKYPLSLRDMSLAHHLSKLQEMGVACIKIEGRMKRPEYVYIITSIYSAALREGRAPTAEELSQLEAAFSRQGFTDGYFQDRTGKDMFGIRQEGEEPRALFSAAKAAYGKEAPRVPFTLSAEIQPNRPAMVVARDFAGHSASVNGSIPEPARTKPLTSQAVSDQLTKTGGTFYSCTDASVSLGEGLSMPVSALNQLRREVLETLTLQRQQASKKIAGSPAYLPAERLQNHREAPVTTVSLSRLEQLTPELLACKPALIYLPAAPAAASPDLVKQILDQGIGVGAMLPRIVWDRELPALKKELTILRQLGVTDALIGNLGLIAPAAELGFVLRGDYGLEIFNSESLLALKELGLRSATASFECKLAQIRDLSKSIDTELLVYGRFPLMITENCIIKNKTGRCSCEELSQLTDRRGARFPVCPAPGCRNEILNSQPLYLADKQADYRSIGLWGTRLAFTVESPKQCIQMMVRYLEQSTDSPKELTRGLYYRDVL
jgi:putative protease